MDAGEKFQLITRNLQEHLGDEHVKKILAERDLNVYWGTATTGKPHIGYFVPMTKVADFLAAGCHVGGVFDLHGYLDNMKAPWDLLMLRTQYYEHVIKAMLTSIGVPLEKLKFVQGTTFQLSREYTLDVYKLMAMTTEHDAKKAGAEVVKQVDSPLLSGLVYPLLQALDEEYLHVDAQFGGVDQRKIFVFAEKYLPQIGYTKRAHFMNPMIGGLSGSKMSSSDPHSKIDLLDDEATVRSKLKKAFCEEGNVTENPILQFVKYVIFPVNSLKDPEYQFKIARSEKNGGDIVFGTFTELEEAFATKALHPADLKAGAAAAFNLLLDPIRQIFKDPKLVALSKEAFPAVPAKKPSTSASDVSRLSIKVGKVVSITNHPDKEHLYVSQVDVADASGPRTIVSGLAKHIPKENIVNSLVIVLTNLKLSKFAGVLSEGMLLAASTADDSMVELLAPPEATPVGTVVAFEGINSEGEPDAQLNPKHKVWEKVSVDLKTSETRVAMYKGEAALVTPLGPVVVPTLTNALIR